MVSDGERAALEKFLAFLDRDMLRNPRSLRSVPAGWLSDVAGLIAGVDIDLDQPLPDDGE